MLAGNTLLRSVVNWRNRRPISADVTEAEYRVPRDLLDEASEHASYPVREAETLSETKPVELAAVLVPSSAAVAELGAIVVALEQTSFVRCAT